MKEVNYNNPEPCLTDTADTESENQPVTESRFKTWRKKRREAWIAEDVNNACQTILDHCGVSELLHLALTGISNEIRKTVVIGASEQDEYENAIRRAMLEEQKGVLIRMIEDMGRENPHLTDEYRKKLLLGDNW